MNKNSNKSKILGFLLVLFVFVSIFSAINVNANFVTLDEDGLIYDEFNNSDDIYTMVNCSNSGGRINLTTGNPVYEYNYAKKPDNLDVWYNDRIFLPEGFLGQIISQYISPDLLFGTSVTSSTNLVKIGSINDGKELNTTGKKFSKTNPTPANPIQHYRFKINQDTDLIDYVTINWWHGPFRSYSNLEKINMYIWSNGSIIPSWKNVSQVIYDSTNIDKTDNSADLNYTFSDVDYIDEDGYIDLLIIGTPDHDGDQSVLSTDFINLSVHTIDGYFSEGYVISEPIEPSDFGGWEKVFWESSDYSEDSGVTLYILDEDENPIEDFSGTNKSFDISDIDEGSIRLKAVLHSTSPYITPFLYSWGVMWQKENGYIDTFDSTYRVEETIGTKIDSGKIGVSDYYSDWEFFGKYPDNTRAYDGKTINSEPDSTYWYTEYGFGGGFRSPVVSEGKVYIASSIDNKIYAFNETEDSDILTQKPVDESNALPFEVDSCIAVTEDYVIVGTSAFGENNKIYALDKNDLSTQVWAYPTTSDKICFSSSPIVKDGKLFVTSWGGSIFDLPFISFINQYIPGNNKLICLNANTGLEVWSAYLPAGSISAPAYGGEFVYAGCQNMYGSSIFAFEADSGDEVWNQTVGIIGRSSPVFADDKIFVLSNEKQNISKIGDYKINCLNALNGKVLWNKSFDQMEITNYARGIKSTAFFYKLIEGFAPISTPSYYEDKLYVVCPNGTLLAISDNGNIAWSYDLSNELLDLSFYTASPMVIGEKLYVITGNANVYCFNFDDNNPVWKYQVSDPDEYILKFLPPDIMASPVLADGLLFVSTTENPANLSGRIYCIGDYAPNSKGTVKSTTIHLPNGKWWDEFKAVKTNTTKNTITFSILDNEDNVLKKITNYDDDYVDISDIKTNGIKILANFNVENTSDDYPYLDSWEVTWTEESGAPVFLDDTFEPGDEGWVNLSIDKCSIEVKDTEDNDILSGIDVDSAQFRLKYIPKNSATPKYSSWYKATSEDESGVVQTRIVADIESLNLEMSQLLEITFRVRDLAGNLATSNTTTFKVDTVKPSSEITDKNALLGEYNDVFVVKAEAQDLAGSSGDANISGISKVILKYQFRNSSTGTWGNWTVFTEKATPFSCYFGKDEGSGDELASGYYRLVTIAVDKAGNHEDLDEDKITDSFLLDLVKPELLNDFEEVSEQKSLPTFSIEIQDDYELDGLYYRLDGENDWNEIKTNIGEKYANINWTMSEETWVEFREGIQRTVYFRITDKVGNEYVTTEEYALKITKDESMNDLYVDLSDFSNWHWDESFKITAETPNEINVDTIQLFYRYSDDNETWTAWKTVGLKTTTPYSWDFTASNRSGNYQFYIEVIDTSGAVYTSSVEDVELTLLPLHHTILVIALAFILLIISVFIIVKLRAKKQ